MRDKSRAQRPVKTIRCRIEERLEFVSLSNACSLESHEFVKLPNDYQTAYGLTDCQVKYLIRCLQNIRGILCGYLVDLVQL